MILQSKSSQLFKGMSEAGGGTGVQVDSGTTLIVLGIIAVVVTIVAIIINRLSKNPTRGLRKLARQHGLDHDQTNILKKAIRDFKITKLEQLFVNSRYLNQNLRKVLNQIDGLRISPTSKEYLKSEIFEIKRLITYFHNASLHKIASTTNIPVGQEVQILSKVFPPFASKVMGKTKEHIAIEHPRDGHGDLVAFKNGTRVKIKFLRDGERLYTFVSNINRSAEIEGEQRLLLTHTDEVTKVMLRKTSRREANGTAFLYQASIVTEGKGRNAKTRAVVNRNKRYSSTFVDISGGGCGLVSRTPLIKGTPVLMQFDIDGQGTMEVFGRIKNVRKQKNGTALMHLSFNRVAPAVSNRINGYVYGIFEEENKRSFN